MEKDYFRVTLDNGDKYNFIEKFDNHQYILKERILKKTNLIENKVIMQGIKLIMF